MNCQEGECNPGTILVKYAVISGLHYVVVRELARVGVGSSIIFMLTRAS